MKATQPTNRELAIAMTSSAGLELFWSAVAIGSALIGVIGTEPLVMSAVAAIASAFALFAHSGELAARWPRTARQTEEPSREAIGLNVLTAFTALGMGALAIAGIAPLVLAPLALLFLAALLVLDAPLETELAAPRGALAGGYMVLAGLAAIIVLTAGFSARGGVPVLVPWAALLVGSAHMAGAGAMLLRFTRAC